MSQACTTLFRGRLTLQAGLADPSGTDSRPPRHAQAGRPSSSLGRNSLWAAAQRACRWAASASLGAILSRRLIRLLALHVDQPNHFGGRFLGVELGHGFAERGAFQYGTPFSPSTWANPTSLKSPRMFFLWGDSPSEPDHLGDGLRPRRDVLGKAQVVISLPLDPLLGCRPVTPLMRHLIAEQPYHGRGPASVPRAWDWRSTAQASPPPVRDCAAQPGPRRPPDFSPPPESAPSGSVAAGTAIVNATVDITTSPSNRRRLAAGRYASVTS